MHLICTGKVFKALNKEPETFSGSYVPFYVWSVGLFQVGRHKALLVMNNASLYSFVLYGVKATQYKDLGLFVRKYIAEYMRSEGFSPEATEHYLQLLPKSECWVKAFNKGMTARLSKIAIDMRDHADMLDLKQYLQLPISRYLNGVIRSNGGRHDMVLPREKFESMLAKLCCSDIRCINAVEMLISVKQEGYIAWRKLHVPVHFSLCQLYEVLQIVFDWLGTSTFSFTAKGENDKKYVYFHDENNVLPESTEQKMLRAEDFTTGKVFKEHDKLWYTSLGATEIVYSLQGKRVVNAYNKLYATCIAGGGMVNSNTLSDVLFNNITIKTATESPEETPAALGVEWLEEYSLFESEDGSAAKEKPKERIFALAQVNATLQKFL